MCAMMPMFRVFSSEYCRSTSRPCFLDSVVSARYMRSGGSACGPPLGSALRLPAIVSERLVGLRHLVRVLALLHGGAAVVRGVEQLGGKLLGHRALGTAPGGADDPPHRQRRPSIGTHLDRHLVGRAALLPAGDSSGVEGPADDVVPNPGEVLDAAASDHHDRVLLEVVADARDVGGHLEAVREPHPRDLPEGGVRLLRRRRVHADTDAAFLRTRLHRGRLRLLPHRLATPSDQLVNGRHRSPSPEMVTKPSLYNRETL